MLSKFSLGLLNGTASRLTTSISVLRNTKSRINWQTVHLNGSARNFQSSKYDLQKLSSKPKNRAEKKAEDVSAQSIGLYTMAVAVLCGGLTFAAVPLYRLFCQVYFGYKLDEFAVCMEIL